MAIPGISDALYRHYMQPEVRAVPIPRGSGRRMAPGDVMPASGGTAPAYRTTGSGAWRRPRDEQAALQDLAQMGYVARDPIEEEHLLSNYADIISGPAAVYRPGIDTPAAWMTEADKRLEDRWAQEDVRDAAVREAQARAERQELDNLKRRLSLMPGAGKPTEAMMEPDRTTMSLAEKWHRQGLPQEYRYTPSPEVTESEVRGPGADQGKLPVFQIPGVGGLYQRTKDGRIIPVKGTKPEQREFKLNAVEQQRYNQAIRELAKLKTEIAKSLDESGKAPANIARRYNELLEYVNPILEQSGSLPIGNRYPIEEDEEGPAQQAPAGPGGGMAGGGQQPQRGRSRVLRSKSGKGRFEVVSPGVVRHVETGELYRVQ